MYFIVHFLLNLILIIICAAYYFQNDAFEEQQQELLSTLPRITLISPFTTMDYKRTYNLRFDPEKLRNNSRFYPNNNNQITQSFNSELELFKNYSDVAKMTTIQTPTTRTITIQPTINSDLLLKNYNRSSTTIGNIIIPPENSTTHIMKPQESRSPMLTSIGQRLKSLIFGSPKTALNAVTPVHRGFLNIFNIVKFENGHCISSQHGVRTANGTCYHRLECDSFGGRPIGTCAGGYGVCCVFQYSCGAVTHQLISYFETPRFPSAITQPITCTFAVKLQPHVRQVRLDFIFFELKRPINGNCVDDQFVISGQSSNFNVPILCGVNTGQHIYIDVEYSLNRELILSLVAKSTNGKAFSIRIMQLIKDCAPDGCLQYHKEQYGYVKSFNYDAIGNIVDATRPTYLNNLNYAICIKRAPDRCSITFSNELNGEEFPFEISNNQGETGFTGPTTGTDNSIPESEEIETSFTRLYRQANSGVSGCPNDFITINSLRLCGDKLNDGTVLTDLNSNSPVTDFGRGPIALLFRTNNETVGRGFRLLYFQQTCN